MARTAPVLIAMTALVAGVFWLGPSPVVRELPEPVPAPVPDASGTLVVDLVDGASLADLDTVEAVLGSLGVGELGWVHPLSADEGLAQIQVTDLDDAVAALQGHALVEYAEPEILLEAYGFPNDPMYDKQWHLREMGAPAAWASTPRGRGVIVAVIDTGVTKVEDLGGTKVLEGMSFVPGTKSAADDNGHGTHVAGTIAQTTNNGVGVAGVAPEATILPVKVLSGGGFGTSSWIAAGIDYAVDEGAEVINLSLGGGYSFVIHNAIRKAHKKGVIVVAAAGNSGRKGVGYPGALKETIGVSALGPGGHLAPYTSWGKGVDIAAPGGDKTKPGGGVWQDTVDGKGGHVYAEYQGTSMASPHVAGAAAALLSTGACDATCVERVLLQTADGDTWDPKLGHGRLDLGAAISKVGPQHGAVRFALGMAFALMVSFLSGAGTRFRSLSAVVGGLVAGGIFFLGSVPFIGRGLVVDLLSSGVLSWPAILVDDWLMAFPLWCSALLPAAVAFTMGAFKESRPIAVGVACGIGAHLFHAASVGSLHPWFMPGVAGSAWLGVNATVCILLALALAGTEKLEEGKR